MSEPKSLAEILDEMLKDFQELNASLDRMVEQEKAFTAELKELAE